MYQPMYSTTASSSWVRLRQTRSAISSVLKLSRNESARAVMLLCQVECGRGGEVGDDEAVEPAGEVSFEAAEDLAAGERFCAAADGRESASALRRMA